jgi:putative glutathione S-transferase
MTYPYRLINCLFSVKPSIFAIFEHKTLKLLSNIDISYNDYRILILFSYHLLIHNKRNKGAVMGRLVNGKWRVEAVNPETEDGEYQRQVQFFRDEIKEETEFEASRDRYHLYISHACPWAHRTMIMRELKGLDFIDVSVVGPHMLENGWEFHDFEGMVKDPHFNARFLHEVYSNIAPDFTGRVTVPILYDKKTNKIVNNESSEIIRIFNTAFNDITGNTEDFYPEKHRSEIDRVNELVYENVNNGVYKSGFARNQKAYEHNVVTLFETLDTLDEMLEGRDYLVGDRLTEADIRLWTTLIRFDLVYYVHFKCNIQHIYEYKNLYRFMKNLYKKEAFRKTTDFDHIKEHYFYSHETLNPFRLVPLGAKTFID